MKKIISMLLALTMLLALSTSAFAMLPAFNSTRDYEMEKTVSMFDENWVETEYNAYFFFYECYGVIEIPDWGKIPVVNEDSYMLMCFEEDDAPDSLYELYPIETRENYAGAMVPSYVDPATDEVVARVMGTYSVHRFDEGMLVRCGADVNADEVAAGTDFEPDDGIYRYTMKNGINQYIYHCREGYEEVDQPVLCTVLALNSDQFSEFKETGAITFELPDGKTYSCDFKGTDLRSVVLYNEKSIAVHEPSSWAADVAQRADLIGISKPVRDRYDDIYYKYDINREEFAGMIIKMLENSVGLNTSELAMNTEIRFDDVFDNDAIYAAAELGIVNGKGEGCFDPDARITRQEIAVMLDRTYKYIESVTGKTYVTGIESDLGRFSDASLIGSWASEAMGRLANKGIINGTSQTAIDPLSNTTVEQAISLVMRVYDEITA